MAEDTKVLQDMADSMLPLFNNMPQVLVVVEGDEVFFKDPYPLAVYRAPNILINPCHARTCDYSDMQTTLCHELIHAWLDREGLVDKGESLDVYHNEWFVKKALEINKLKIDGLRVDVDYLLTNSDAEGIYNRLTGIRFAAHLRHKIRKIKNMFAASAKPLVRLEFPLDDRVSKVVTFGFPVLLASMFLHNAHLIPVAVTSVIWATWAVVGLFGITRRIWNEAGSKGSLQKWYAVVTALGLGGLILYVVMAILQHTR